MMIWCLKLGLSPLGDLMGNLLSIWYWSYPQAVPHLSHDLEHPLVPSNLHINLNQFPYNLYLNLLLFVDVVSSPWPKLLYTMHYILVINSEDTVCSIQFKAGKIPALRGIMETCGTFGNVSSQKKQCLLAWAERGIAYAAIKWQDWLSSYRFWTI